MLMATACVLGVPAERMVYGSRFEREYWALVAERAVEVDSLRRDNQARAIAKEIADVLRRMFTARRGGRGR